jgi:hypothetical protein
MSKPLFKQELAHLASPKAQAYLLAALRAARERLDQTSAALAEIANWRDRIRRKIANAKPDCDLSQFVAEVRALKAVCRALARRGQ